MTVDEILDLKKRARLSAPSVPQIHGSNPDLAMRGAMRAELRERAKLDELKLARTRLRKLLHDVDELRAKIAELEAKRLAEAAPPDAPEERAEGST